jgi:hypothetical protein
MSNSVFVGLLFICSPLALWGFMTIVPNQHNIVLGWLLIPLLYLAVPVGVVFLLIGFFSYVLRKQRAQKNAEGSESHDT